MREILIVKNIAREGPGVFGEILAERGIRHQIVDLSQGEAFPPSKNYAAGVVLGGPDSANDGNDKMRQELAQVQAAIHAKVPYLGICLGLQVLVKAAGGKVIKSPIKEIGFRDPEGNSFTYGIQCHFELTQAMFETWLAADPDLLKRDQEQLRTDFHAMKEPYTLIGSQLFQNFLNIAGF